MGFNRKRERKEIEKGEREREGERKETRKGQKAERRGGNLLLGT